MESYLNEFTGGNIAKRSEAAAMRRTNEEKLRVAVLVSKAASSYIQGRQFIQGINSRRNQIFDRLQYSSTKLQEILLKESQDENFQQESDLKLGKHGSLEYLRVILLILQTFSNMENMEWFLLYTSIILEGTSAVFEQLQLSLLGLVMAALGLLLCLVELACKLKKEHATFEYKGCLPWFYSTYPKHKLFGSTIEFFGLGAAIWQVFHSAIDYLYARRNLQNPIQMTIVMFMFCLSQLIAKLIEKTSKPDPELEGIIVQR